MFINNINKFASKVYKCTIKRSKILLEAGIPMLGRDERYVYFAKTKRLYEELIKMGDLKNEEGKL